MPLWSTHEIELLIKEIEQRHCLWNILNFEYKDRVKTSDARKKVLDRDQMEINKYSMCDLVLIKMLKISF